MEVCITKTAIMTEPDGKPTTSSYCVPSSSCCLLDSCCFKELPLPLPHANQVFEHAGMWWPIVQPIV